MVLDDADWGFRDVEDDRAALWPRLLTREDTSCQLLVLKLSGSLPAAAAGQSPLWRHLERTRQRFARRIIVINGDDLRRAGQDIARRLSWDRTAGDLLRLAETSGGLIARLRQFGDLIVRLDLDGALLIPAEAAAAHWLVCVPGAIEGDFAKAVARFLRHNHASSVIGATASFVAALTARIVATPAEAAIDWIDALGAGLSAARRVHEAGMRLLKDKSGALRLTLAASAPFAAPNEPLLRAFDTRAVRPGTLAEHAAGPQDAGAGPDLATRFAVEGERALVDVPHLSLDP